MASRLLPQAEDAPSTDAARVVICLSSYGRFSKLSCNERPVGRGLTFVPGNVETRIRTITARHSLLPTSQTGIPMGAPCGLLSLAGEIPGFHVPLQKSAGLGACCRPGGVSVTRAQKLKTLPTSSTFWFKRVNPLRLSYITIFRRRFRYLHHTSYLALTRFWGYQEGPPLAIKPPHSDTVLRYIVRAALDSCP